jgi:hypothetical protein
VAENQPGKTKNRMSPSNAFSGLTARVREFIRLTAQARSSPVVKPLVDETERFEQLALELFARQYAHNRAFRLFCDSRKSSPETVRHWMEIPPVPAPAFKEFEFSCLSAEERTTVFHSSGTTGHKPSRHFQNAASLAVYEDSLWSWFSVSVPGSYRCRRLLSLTPPIEQARLSSLVHMIETIRRRSRFEAAEFLATVVADNSWVVNEHSALDALAESVLVDIPVLICGTAFSFVHLLEFLETRRIALTLPKGSQIFETGGYKGRARALPKSELHAMMGRQLGVPSGQIVCEYGMSELSSQAYDGLSEADPAPEAAGTERARVFHFPPWAKARILSPETDAEVDDGETGLVCVCDLANVYSVMAIQTEDLAVRRGAGFELLGRAAAAEARGCSLMAAG